MKLCSHLMAILMIHFAPTVASAKDLKKQSITSESRDGVVMFTAPVVFGDYQFMFSPFVEGTDTVRGSEFVVVRSNGIPAPAGLGTLQMHRMPAGTYVIRIVTTQSWWGACLSENTLKFDVRPGQVTYIGRVDPTPTLRSIDAEVVRTGKATSSGGQLRLFKENVVPPIFTFDGAARATELLDIARGSGFSTDGPIVDQQPVSARFRRIDITGIAYCK